MYVFVSCCNVYCRYHVVSFFDAKTVLTVGMISRAWASIAQDDIIWKVGALNAGLLPHMLTLS